MALSLAICYKSHKGITSVTTYYRRVGTDMEGQVSLSSECRQKAPQSLRTCAGECVGKAGSPGLWSHGLIPVCAPSF